MSESLVDWQLTVTNREGIYILKVCISYEGRHSLYEVLLFFLKLYIFEDLLIFECLILELYSKYNF